MSDNTKIEWADATVNAINGCSLESPGCTNCYAMRLAGTRLKHHPSRVGLTQDSKAGPVWTGEVRLNETALLQPLKWKRPRRIFWNAHGDLFHPNVPDEWIDLVFAVCALTPQHTHMILTKRSGRMRDYVGEAWPLHNAWLGVSVEDQTRADQRVPDLLATPAAVRFISAEPLLGPLDLAGHLSEDWEGYASTWTDQHGVRRGDLTGNAIDGIDWVIVGGESGPAARPMANDWAQCLVDQCQSAGVAVFVKQLSSGGPRPIHDIEQFPEGLRVREFPT